MKAHVCLESMHIIMRGRVADSLCHMDSRTLGLGEKRGGNKFAVQHVSAVWHPNDKSAGTHGVMRNTGAATKANAC